jgi:hypothetical protein
MRSPMGQWGITVSCMVALLLGASDLPSVATAMVRRVDALPCWLPGRHSFAALLALAGLWWVYAYLRLNELNGGPHE